VDKRAKVDKLLDYHDVVATGVSGTILQVRQPNQQHHSPEGLWLVNQFKDQSHQVQLTKRLRNGCNQKRLRPKIQRCSEDRKLNQDQCRKK